MTFVVIMPQLVTQANTAQIKDMSITVVGKHLGGIKILTDTFGTGGTGDSFF
jgi:hypothetical protein